MTESIEDYISNFENALQDRVERSEFFQNFEAKIAPRRREVEQEITSAVTEPVWVRDISQKTYRSATMQDLVRGIDQLFEDYFRIELGATQVGSVPNRSTVSASTGVFDKQVSGYFGAFCSVSALHRCAAIYLPGKGCLVRPIETTRLDGNQLIQVARDVIRHKLGYGLLWDATTLGQSLQEKNLLAPVYAQLCGISAAPPTQQVEEICVSIEFVVQGWCNWIERYLLQKMRLSIQNTIALSGDDIWGMFSEAGDEFADELAETLGEAIGEGITDWVSKWATGMVGNVFSKQTWEKVPLNVLIVPVLEPILSLIGERAVRKVASKSVSLAQDWVRRTRQKGKPEKAQRIVNSYSNLFHSKLCSDLGSLGLLTAVQIAMATDCKNTSVSDQQANMRLVMLTRLDNSYRNDPERIRHGAKAELDLIC